MVHRLTVHQAYSSLQLHNIRRLGDHLDLGLDLEVLCLVALVEDCTLVSKIMYEYQFGPTFDLNICLPLQ